MGYYDCVLTKIGNSRDKYIFQIGESSDNGRKRNEKN